MAGLHTLECLYVRTGLPHLSTPLPPCARCRMTTTTLQNHPPPRRRGYAVSLSEPAIPGVQPMGWLWPCRGRTWGGPGGAASVGGVHVSREAGNPRASSCRGAGSVSESSCPVPPKAGQGRRSPAEENLSMCPVPGEGADTNNNNSTSRRPGGEESFWPASE